MGLTRSLLNAAYPGWMVLVVGALIATYTGQAEPYLSPADVPLGSGGAFVGAMGLVAVGWLGIAVLQSRAESRAWMKTGRRAGFTAADGVDSGAQADLSATVDGREVTARIRKRTRTSSGPDGGSQTSTFTLVETALDGPVTEGVVAGFGGGTIVANSESIDVRDMAKNVHAGEDLADAAGRDLVTVADGDVVAVGTSEVVARAVASGSAADALRALETLNVVYVGDADGVVAAYVEHVNAGFDGVVGSLAERSVDKFTDRVPADGGTVTVETATRIRDADELERHARAVVAVADAFEAAGSTGSRR